MKAEPRKRGRPTAPHPRRNLSIYLTPEEEAELSAAHAAHGLGTFAEFVRYAALRWVRSADGRYETYVDSGQADADEAAAIAADLAALETEPPRPAAE